LHEIMSAQEQRIFGCPACGAAVTGLEDECPRCHKKFDESVKFECPFCGEWTHAGYPSCPSCHVSFYGISAKTRDKSPEKTVEDLLDQLKSMEAQLVKRGGLRFTCPSCLKLLKGDEDKCPSCGAAFRKVAQLRCPVCSSLVISNLSKCPKCNHVFVPEPEIAVETMPAKETKAEEELDLSEKLDRLSELVARRAEPEPICPTCGRAVPKETLVCPNCGPKLAPSEIPQMIKSRRRTEDQAIAELRALLDLIEERKAKRRRKLKGEAAVSVPKETAAPPQRGLASTVGRINGMGPAKGRGAINGRGVVNGKGAINGRGLVSEAGAINGKGAINGIPFVNGTGISNGIKPRKGVAVRARGFSTVLLKWQFLAIIIAIVVVVPTSIYFYASRQGGQYSVDGDFDEWADAPVYDVQVLSATAGPDIEEWAIGVSDDDVYFYIRTQGPMMSTIEVESYFLYVDVDGSTSTGYIVSGIGAEYLLELDGWNGTVQSSSIMYYSGEDDQYDWNSWESAGSLVFSKSTNEIEASGTLMQAIGDDARALLVYKDQQERSAVSHPVPVIGGLLVVRQELAPAVDTTGIIEVGTSVQLLKLTFACEGASGTVSQVIPTLSGCTPAASVPSFSLSPGEERIVFVTVDTSLASAGQLVTANVNESSVQSSFKEVEVIGPEGMAYVTSPPSSIVIDGAFADWAGKVVSDSDAVHVANPNLDIQEVGKENSSDSAFFYVSVEGEIFAGSFIPKFCSKPSGGGGGVVILPRKTAEDVTRIFVDTDATPSTGQSIVYEEELIGADRMVEVKGLFGVVTEKSLFRYSSGTWAEEVSTVDAANDDKRVEISVDLASLGGNASFEFVVETTSWSGSCDMAGYDPSTTRMFVSPPAVNMWPIDSSTASSAATAMSYQRKLFYDSSNFWSFYFDGTNTVYRYSTNGGVTWSSKTNAFTTSGVNEVSVWYSSGNNLVYAVGDTSTSSTSIYLRKGTVNPGPRTINWDTETTLASSTYALANKNTFITRDADGYIWVASADYVNTVQGRYQVTVFKSGSADTLSGWTNTGSLLTGQGSSSPQVVCVVVPAGSGSDVWAIYGAGGGVYSRKNTGSWSAQTTLQSATASADGPSAIAPPSVVVDSRGIVHVVYGDCTETPTKVPTPRLKYRYNNTGATNFAAEQDVDPYVPSDCADVYPSVSLETVTRDLYFLFLRTDTSIVGKQVMGRKLSSGSWTNMTINTESTYTKQYLTSIYSVSGEFQICWQWTQNTSAPMEVIFDKIIPEFDEIAVPLVIMTAMFIVFRRKSRKRTVFNVMDSLVTEYCGTRS